MKGKGEIFHKVSEPENRQIKITVDGCKVTLNFPDKPEDSAVGDIKRIMLDGILKA